MSDEVRGRTIYEKALDLIDEGISVAIVPICSADRDKIGLYALTVDLDVYPEMKKDAYSSHIRERETFALGMTVITSESAQDKNYRHRRVP
jgi:hypothetical protein